MYVSWYLTRLFIAIHLRFHCLIKVEMHGGHINIIMLRSSNCTCCRQCNVVAINLVELEQNATFVIRINVHYF